MAASGRGKNKREGQTGYGECGEEALGTTGLGTEVEVGLGGCRSGGEVQERGIGEG